MDIRIFAATLTIVAVPLPAIAQNGAADTDTSALPSADDRLRALGGQLLLELFTRATKGTATSSTTSVEGATTEPGTEPAPAQEVEPVVEGTTATTEAGPAEAPPKAYLRSQRRTDPVFMPRPQ